MSAASVPLVSRYTYRRHVQASILEGVLWGVLITGDVVARKSLGASQWQIVLLTMAPAVLMLTSLLTTPRIESADRRLVFLVTGILGRLILLGMGFIASPWPFLALLIVHGWVQSLIIPAQNAIYQSNYDPRTRGRLFGWASMYGGLATAATALVSGILLDRNPDAYRWLYPIAGVSGFASCLAYGAIRVRRARRDAGEGSARKLMTIAAATEMSAVPRPTALGVLHETLIRDAGFRRFELAMFVYGAGFMCMQPVFARLFVDELRMEYSHASLAKGVLYYAAYILGLGPAGRLMDRIGLERLCLRSFLALFLFAALIVWVQTPGQAVAAFAVYGLGMAGINIAWSMGPIHFAPPGSSSRYMGVHVALVGVRALGGHIAGGAVADVCGNSKPVFVLAAALFALAALLIHRAMRLNRREEAARRIPEPAGLASAAPQPPAAQDRHPAVS
jgi:MFS family permease